VNYKVKSITAFNKFTNRLKNVVRSGWKNWGVSAGRLESVAEHSHGAQMLAYAVWENFKDEYPDVDIGRVISMLAFHEIEEIIIPDYTPLDKIPKAERRRQGKEAVDKVAGVLPESDFMRGLIEECEEARTPDARFAKMVDSLEAGLQCQIYDERGEIDLSNPEAREALKSHDIKGRGHDCLSDSWLANCCENYGYDENFIEVATQAQKRRR
jgi:putative hydrolase of HD superfamily